MKKLFLVLIAALSLTGCGTKVVYMEKQTDGTYKVVNNNPKQYTITHIEGTVNLYYNNLDNKVYIEFGDYPDTNYLSTDCTYQQGHIYDKNGEIIQIKEISK